MTMSIYGAKITGAQKQNKIFYCMRVRANVCLCMDKSNEAEVKNPQ